MAILSFGLSLLISYSFAADPRFVGDKPPLVLYKGKGKNTCRESICIGQIERDSGTMHRNGVSADHTIQWRACPQVDDVCPSAGGCLETGAPISLVGDSIYKLDSPFCSDSVCLHVEGPRIRACPPDPSQGKINGRSVGCSASDSGCVDLQLPNQIPAPKIPGDFAIRGRPASPPPAASSALPQEHRLHPQAADKTH